MTQYNKEDFARRVNVSQSTLDTWKSNGYVVPYRDMFGNESYNDADVDKVRGVKPKPKENSITDYIGEPLYKQAKRSSNFVTDKIASFLVILAFIAAAFAIGSTLLFLVMPLIPLILVVLIGIAIYKHHQRGK